MHAKTNTSAYASGVNGKRRHVATRTAAPIHAGNVSLAQLNQSVGPIAEIAATTRNAASRQAAFARALRPAAGPVTRGVSRTGRAASRGHPSGIRSLFAASH